LRAGQAEVEVMNSNPDLPNGKSGLNAHAGLGTGSTNLYTWEMTTPTIKRSALRIAVLCLSDTRSLATDTSGDYLVAALASAGHILHERGIEKDDRYALRARVSAWIADANCDVVLLTGGTGFTGRDSTVEAIEPLLDKLMPGFGEVFRWLSYQDIGSSALQSRAFAGVANGTFVFALPGSTGACKLAWESLICDQLNASTKPCNLVALIPRLRE
jgi:molybdopterin adenylyltransferase